MAGAASALRRLYLSVYNWIVFFGWAQVLYYAVLTLRESVYAAVERPLQFAQTAAIMEILHGLVGLVRSPVSATLPQIGSRLFLTWGVLWSFPETQSHLLVTTLVISWSITEVGGAIPRKRGTVRQWPRCRLCCCQAATSVFTDCCLSRVMASLVAQIPHSIIGLVRSPISATLPQVSGRILVTWYIVWSFPETQSHVLVTSLVLSWSITEVIRYSFFGLKEAFGITPFWLLWLRYTTFTVLYPIGLISEVGLIFTAMPHMKGRSFYICAALTTLYIPGFPYLYRYMLAQRKKVLSKAKAA